MENQNNGVNPQEYYNPNAPQQPQYQQPVQQGAYQQPQYQQPVQQGAYQQPQYQQPMQQGTYQQPQGYNENVATKNHRCRFTCYCNNLRHKLLAFQGT